MNKDLLQTLSKAIKNLQKIERDVNVTMNNDLSQIISKAIKKLQQIEKDINQGEVRDNDLCMAEEVLGLVDIWEMRRNEADGGTRYSNGNATQPNTLAQPQGNEVSQPSRMNIADEQARPPPTRAQVQRKERLEQRLAHMTGMILIMASKENPELPLAHPSQPKFVSISRFELHGISLLFSDLIEKNQDGHVDEDEMGVYDPTMENSTKKIFITDQIIYMDGLLDSFYSQCQDGHDDLAELGNERIWMAFENILKFAKWGHFGENEVNNERQDDLEKLCLYLEVADDFKAALDRICMGERG